MSLIYLHGEQLLPFILGLLLFTVLGWGAIIYMAYKFLQKSLRKKRPRPRAWKLSRSNIVGCKVSAC